MQSREIYSENVNNLTKKIFVGNLSFNTTEDEVNELLSQFGTIQSLAMINDRDTGRFRGFCFVEMEDSRRECSHQRIE